MLRSQFTPDPLFFTVGYKVREIKATEKQILAIYSAGAQGLKKDAEIAIACNMTVDEYRSLCQNDRVAETAAIAGYVHGKLAFTQKMMDEANGGDVKAIAFILTHIYDMMPAKPAADTDATVTIVVKNAEPELSED